MMTFAIYVLGVATLAAWLLTLAYKWGAVEWVQLHGGHLLAQLCSCQFCLSWWACVVVACVAAVATRSPELLATPFFATKITQKLL